MIYMYRNFNLYFKLTVVYLLGQWRRGSVGVLHTAEFYVTDDGN